MSFTPFSPIPEPIDVSIDEVVDDLGLPEPVRTTAKSVFETADEENLARGRYENLSKGAAVYLSCRIHDSPTSPEEVAECCDISEKKLLKSSRHVTKELGLPIPPADPATFIDRYAVSLGLDTSTRELAHKILEACEGTDLSSGSPTGIAASSIYAASSEEDTGVTQATLSELANISPVTIRNRYTKQLDVYKNTR